jgi:glutathione S-transferase
MSLTLYCHPLASYCWKVLLALYEADTAFQPHHVDLGQPAERAMLEALWPVAKFPVLRDTARNQVVPESSIIIEYLALHYPGRVALLPGDPDQARETRLRDRFYDLYVHEPMQKIVGDRLRPAEKRDPHGVAQAHATLALSYAMLERDPYTSEAASGSNFTLADCAAAPALYYADKVHPLGDQHLGVTAYLNRLLARPSFARVLAEAAPYFAQFPG